MNFPEWTLFMLSLENLAKNVTSWFSQMMFSCNQVFFFYLSAVAIYQLVRLLLSPILGASLAIGASDSVRAHRELSRQRGKFEKGGKYLRK